MKLVVDGMLGGLARWLRMLGYETEYDAKMDDKDLLRLSQDVETVLLTRDKELYNRAISKRIKSVLVLGETEEARLGQLSKQLGISLDIDMSATRCPRCGSMLRGVSKDDVAGQVPAASLKLHDRFWRCANSDCAKTYWVGSHWNRIRQTLEGARKISLRE